MRGMGNALAWPKRWFELGPVENRRLLSMEGLRGVAVLLVFGVHYAALFQVWADPDPTTSAAAAAMRQVGHAGVDLFFVLSGYLIYGAAIRGRVGYVPFMRRRIRRIYPTFLLVFVVYLALSLAAPSLSRLPTEPGSLIAYLAANLLLLPGLFPIEPLITVAWSLSFEFAYYLTLPLIVAAAGLRSRTAYQRMAFFTALLVLYLASCLVVPVLPARLAMFVGGIIMYDVLGLARSRSDTGAASRPVLVAPVVVGCAVLVVIGSWIGASPDPTVKISPASDVIRVACLVVAFGVLSGLAFLPGSAIGRPLSWAPLRWLGNMSYSFYLIHGLVTNVLARILTAKLPQGGSVLLFWGFLPVSLAVASAVSAGLFMLVERPFSLDGRGLISPAALRRTGAVWARSTSVGSVLPHGAAPSEALAQPAAPR